MTILQLEGFKTFLHTDERGRWTRACDAITPARV